MNEITYRCKYQLINKDKIQCFPDGNIKLCPLIKNNLLKYSQCSNNGIIKITWTAELINNKILKKYFIKQ